MSKKPGGCREPASPTIPRSGRPSAELTAADEVPDDDHDQRSPRRMTALRASGCRLEHRPVASLIPYARNARTHTEAQVALIAGSIREFGFANPVLVDGENGVIAGHGRLLAARKLGLEQVPVIELGTPHPGAEAGLHPRRQQARRARRLGPRAAGARGRRAVASSASTSAASASRPARSTRCSTPASPIRARRRRPSRRPSRCRAPAISGCSGRIACSAATPPTPPPSRGCWAASRRS